MIDHIFQAVREIVRESRQLSADFARIKAASLYLKSVKTARTIVLVVVGIAVATVILMAGLVAIHAGFILYFEPGRHRAYAALALGSVEILSAFFWLWHTLSEKSWMRLSHSDEVFESVNNGGGGHNGGRL